TRPGDESLEVSSATGELESGTDGGSPAEAGFDPSHSWEAASRDLVAEVGVQTAKALDPPESEDVSELQVESDDATPLSDTTLAGDRLESDPQPDMIRSVDEGSAHEPHEVVGELNRRDRVRGWRDVGPSRDAVDASFRSPARDPRNRRTERPRVGSERRG